MADHETMVTIEHGSIELQKKGTQIKFVFRADGDKLGELSISAGGVAFKGRHHKKETKWSSTRFIRILEENV